MTGEQRTRMIERFMARKRAAEPNSLEARFCKSIAYLLCYGAGVRVAAAWSRAFKEDTGYVYKTP